MAWSIVSFGKYKELELTLPQILFKDPDWFFYIYNQAGFSWGLKAQADEIYKKARNIKIPENSKNEFSVEYFIHPSVGKFDHFEIVLKTQPNHLGSSPSFRDSKIDMMFPCTLGSYDKRGCKNMISSIKRYVFKNDKLRLTAKICEDFFDNSDNFIYKYVYNDGHNLVTLGHKFNHCRMESDMIYFRCDLRETKGLEENSHLAQR